MTPRCFLAIGGIGPRRIGGEIFSNVKAGIVYPLGTELKHPWTFPPNLVGTIAGPGIRSTPSSADEELQAYIMPIVNNLCSVAPLST
jgi:hypothetical protein